MKSNELFRASGIMALGTIISRITGFIRGILIVAVLGTALLADTYNVANTMPNILYNLLVGGALTAIFIPQLVRSFEHDDGGDGFASRLITTISLILLVLFSQLMTRWNQFLIGIKKRALSSKVDQVLVLIFQEFAPQRSF